MTEARHQQNLFTWARLARAEYPELALLYSIPNESKRSVSQGRRLRETGMRKGFPDLCLPVARGRFGALYIELKAERGRVRPEQKLWLAELEEAGNLAVVAWGWEHAREIILGYLHP